MSNTENMNKKIDLKGLIPSGENLRVLLNSEHISEGEINSILKIKGIFCGISDKIISVPLLTSTLLTSDEYAKIIDSSTSRSLKPKYKTSQLELVDANANWQKSLKEIFNSDLNISKDIPNIKIKNSVRLIVIDENTAKIQYVITRNDFSKDFLNRQLDFSGEVLIRKLGNGVNLESNFIHTSKETELINRRIGSAIARGLKDLGIVKSDIENKITFSAFNDLERIRFFKRLTGGFDSYLRLNNVNKMIINREGNQSPLPNDPQIVWMKDAVKSMSIDGEKLHNIFLISDEKYYPYYFIDSIDITYEFNIDNSIGDVKICFFFDYPRNKNSLENADLTFSVVSTKCKHEINASSKRIIEREICGKVRLLLNREYQKILDERSI